MATGKPNGSSVFWWVWLERFWQDLRHGARMFAKNPGFTAIAVISIAFGTGANVAIFSVADALILRPLPVARPNELVTVCNRTVRGIFKSNVASYPDYADIRDRSQSFDGLVAFASERVGLSVSPKAAPELRIATLVSGNFFRVLGVEPQLGRGFPPQEDQVPGRDRVAVLSYGLWQQDLNRKRLRGR
jgi:macrolide transport system ATP-binding/permease protein